MGMKLDNTTILLFLAILPVILILLYINSQDKNKEPPRLLLKLFGGGLASCGLVLIISGILEKINPIFSPTSSKNLFQIVFYAFISVALIEEVSKWIFVYILGYKSKEFDEPYDGIVYAVFVSLGFAFVENILYVIISNSMTTALVRALCAVPSHACDAIFMGYHISLAKEFRTQKQYSKEKQQLLLSILMPTIIHGTYDFCLLSGYRIFTFIFLIFIVCMYFVSINKLNTLSESKAKVVETEKKFCTKCGRLLNENNKCNICDEIFEDNKFNDSNSEAKEEEPKFLIIP